MNNIQRMNINLFFNNKRHYSTKKGLQDSICQSLDVNSCEIFQPTKNKKVSKNFPLIFIQI